MNNNFSKKTTEVLERLHNIPKSAKGFLLNTPCVLIARIDVTARHRYYIVIEREAEDSEI